MEKNDDAVSKIEELRAELNTLKDKKKKLDKKPKTKKLEHILCFWTFCKIVIQKSQ